jgi:TrmH family RNA methyltransferase
MQIQTIESLSNPRVKRVRGLKEKKNRIQCGLFLADGDLLVQEALQSGMPVREVWIEGEKEHAFDAQVQLAVEKGVQIVRTNAAVMHSICQTVTPQGIAALVELPAQTPPPPRGGLLCLLEDVADPGNVGTIIRTADAVHADAVLLCGACADAYAPKVVRASMGSLFHLPVVQLPDAIQAAAFYQNCGYTLVGTHLHGVCAFSDEIGWQKKTLLITGSEARGMSETLSGMCDTLLRLPMPGKSESLNAAVATGVFLYTWLRCAR